MNNFEEKKSRPNQLGPGKLYRWLGCLSLVPGGGFGYLQRTHQWFGCEPPMVESLNDLSCSKALWPSTDKRDLQRNGGSYRIMEATSGPSKKLGWTSPQGGCG